MKVSLPKETNTKPSKMLLPLVEDPSDYELDKNNSVSYNLRTIPADDDSPTYKCVVRVLAGNESVRSIIKWKADAIKVAKGLNAIDLASKLPIFETLMRTGPLALFGQSMLAQATMAMEAAIAAAPDVAAGNVIRAAGPAPHQDVAHCEPALDFVVSQLMPRKVLAKVKRDVRRNMRKPHDMKVRQYYQNLYRINFEELPNLPPFHVGQALTNDELVDVLLFGTPKSWQKEMDKQGFDPVEGTLDDLVTMMENIEASEEFVGDKSESNKKKGSSSSNNNTKGKRSSSSNGEQYCMLHGKGNHATEDCIKLKAEAKRLKGNSDKESSGKNYQKSKNKTWERKSNEASGKAKSDLAAIIKKQVKTEVKAAEKKRKAAAESEDLGNVEIDIDLNEFNYVDGIDNMNLKQGDDDSTIDEVSV
jgi:hypothetical protein